MIEAGRKLGSWLLTGGLAAGLACGPDPSPAAGPTATIRDRVVQLEIARTNAEQTQGLSDRASLDWHSGMLFVYDEADFRSFWMLRMHFDIDIVWIRDGRIVSIARFVPHPRDTSQPLATVRSPELADAVLEVPAGYAQANGWRRGDRVTFDLRATAKP